jgi:hypothetical protein
MSQPGPEEGCWAGQGSLHCISGTNSMFCNTAEIGLQRVLAECDKTNIPGCRRDTAADGRTFMMLAGVDQPPCKMQPTVYYCSMPMDSPFANVTNRVIVAACPQLLCTILHKMFCILARCFRLHISSEGASEEWRHEAWDGHRSMPRARQGYSVQYRSRRGSQSFPGRTSRDWCAPKRCQKKPALPERRERELL